MTLRAIQTAEAIAAEPGWMASFLASLARDDLAPATLRGYRYDLRHFSNSAFNTFSAGNPQTAAKFTHNIACNTLPCTFTRMGLPPLQAAGEQPAEA
jgi:hypothetical protein